MKGNYCCIFPHNYLFPDVRFDILGLAHLQLQSSYPVIEEPINLNPIIERMDRPSIDRDHR